MNPSILIQTILRLFQTTNSELEHVFDRTEWSGLAINCQWSQVADVLGRSDFEILEEIGESRGRGSKRDIGNSRDGCDPSLESKLMLVERWRIGFWILRWVDESLDDRNRGVGRCRC